MSRRWASPICGEEYIVVGDSCKSALPLRRFGFQICSEHIDDLTLHLHGFPLDIRHQ